MGISLIAGCYTMVKHPVIQEKQDNDLVYNIYFTDDCASCHSVPAVSLRPNLNYINNSPRWNFFYEHPWWQQDIFYGSNPVSPDSGGANGGLPTTSARPRFPGSAGGPNDPPQTNIGTSSGGSSSTRISGARNSSQTTTTTSTDSESSSGRKSQEGSSSRTSGGSRSSDNKPDTTDNKDKPKHRK